MKNGNIILLNGVTSAGKSTFSKELQALSHHNEWTAFKQLKQITDKERQ